MSNTGCTLFEGSREKSQASIKGKLFDDYIGLRGVSMVYFVRGRGLLEGSPTLANLGNDHGFISKEYISIGMRPFKGSSKKTYAQSGRYFTTMEI